MKLTLSPRESEIMTALDTGERVTDIAKRLGLSKKTVSTLKLRATVKRETALQIILEKHAP